MLLHQKFIETARRYPDTLAIIDRSTDRSISYSKALIAALILSGRFKKVKDGFIGVMLPTSAGAALATLGVLMAGKTPVMINYSTGAERNARFAQRRCDFDLIITSKQLLEKIGCRRLPEMVFLEEMMADISGLEKAWAALKSKLPTPVLRLLTKGSDPDATSVILFTSGSEQEPKAVQLSHRNILANIEAFSEVLTLKPGMRELCVLPFFHVFGLTTNLWTPLYHGMTLITYANPLDFRTVSSIVREEWAQMMVGTPAFFWGYALKSDPGDYETIELAVCGADKCPNSLREIFRRKHNVELLEGYGATETSPVISTNLPESNRPGSVGKPLPNLKVKIQDYQTGEQCRPGQVGKILVKGESVMKGYFGDLEETSMRIHNGWYDTGDMGYLDEDGYLWHAGRLRRFVKIGGEMVSLVNVEDVLAKHLPEGAECCVVETPDATRGARIVAAATIEVNRKSIQDKLSRELPKIALPKEFVKLDELPKMGSGKVDFRRTAEIVRSTLHRKPAEKYEPEPLAT